MKKSLVNLSLERVDKAILMVRGERVILDSDLARLWCNNSETQSTGQEEPGALPERFHVPIDEKRVRRFDIAICNIKAARRAAQTSSCFH